MTGHRETPASGVERTLRVVDGSHVPPQAVASLQAACEILRDVREPLTSISVSGRLPDPALDALPVLAAAERLAAEYGLAVDLHLDGAAYEVHFHRRAS
jgi:cytosine/adenosine deaminase-related metal-dependent hydrolase